MHNVGVSCIPCLYNTIIDNLTVWFVKPVGEMILTLL